MTLIDPAAQPPEKSGDLAEKADRAGTDFLLIGGSTDINSHLVDITIEKITAKTERRQML